MRKNVYEYLLCAGASGTVMASGITHLMAFPPQGNGTVCVEATGTLQTALAGLILALFILPCAFAILVCWRDRKEGTKSN